MFVSCLRLYGDGGRRVGWGGVGGVLGTMMRDSSGAERWGGGGRCLLQQVHGELSSWMFVALMSVLGSRVEKRSQKST